MAITTQGTTLGYADIAGATTWLYVPVRNFPDISMDRERVDITTLGDVIKKSSDGIYSGDALEFTCLYDEEKFNALYNSGNGFTGKFFKLKFSDGSYFMWQGDSKPAMTGKGVGEVLEFKLIIHPTSIPTFTKA